MSFLKRRDGVIALITAIVIALFLFSVGILLGVQGNTSIFSGQSTNQSDKAEALAQTGIEDALIKLGRNASYTGSYNLTETDGTIAITVSSGIGNMLIASTGTVVTGKESVQRKIQATVTFAADGQSIASVVESDQ